MFRFSCSFAPTIWNTFRLDIRNSPFMCCFRLQIKTLFYSFLGHFSPLIHPLRQRFGEFPVDIVGYSNLLTYLFTYLHTDQVMYGVLVPLVNCAHT